MPKKILIDTDIGPDCDDAGALALANRLHNEKKIELLGVTHCTSDIGGAYTVCAINQWFGNSDVPVGQTAEKSFLDSEDCKSYTKPISAEFIRKNGERDFEEAVSLLRRTLAENTDVTLVFIGPLNNLSALLRSAPDSVSPMNGRALVEKSVSQIVVMGGDFSRNTQEAEYNIKCNISAAQLAAESCPVPVIYSGFEIGADVLTGKSLKTADEKYPVRTAYELFLDGPNEDGFLLRPSWDLITVYYAAAGLADLWELSEAVTVRFDGDGCVQLSKGGKDRYLIQQADSSAVAERLEQLLI